MIRIEENNGNEQGYILNYVLKSFTNIGPCNMQLKVTSSPSLSYIGFSQGTAQGFSALSMSRKLNKQVNLFIALAPATKPKGIW